MSIETMDAAIDELQELRTQLKEAERKLKIAEDALEHFAHRGWVLMNPEEYTRSVFERMNSMADEALKQIRGE